MRRTIMTRYHFHQRGETCEFLDADGHEMAGADLARKRAIAGLRSIIADDILHGELHPSARIDVQLSSGELMFSIGLEDVLSLTESDRSALLDCLAVDGTR